MDFFPIAIPDLGQEERKNLIDAFDSTWISSRGAYIDQFEERFAQFCGSAYGVSAANGTVALHLALAALGIGEGDEVIIPDLTFAATGNAVFHAHATPVIVDVEESSWCIDPKAIAQAITPKTKGIIVVHLYGQACDMDPIMDLAKQHNIAVIEDCAEAHGASYKGQLVGSIGDVGCFSFFGNKIITTGEGGMCTTNDESLNKKMRELRDHGMKPEKRYWHDQIGFNYRMTNLQASIGCAQLNRINDMLATRRRIEDTYKSILSQRFDVSFQRDFDNRQRVTWLTSFLINEGQSEFEAFIKSKNLDSRPFFFPLSDMPPYENFSKQNPVSASLGASGVNLPTYGDPKLAETLITHLTS